MAKTEHPMSALAAYIPESSFDDVVYYLNLYKVHLTVTKKRKSVLGDYRHNAMNKNHRISINGNLNKFEFLITLLHEIAHLLTFEQYGNRVEAHGKEWKMHYKTLLMHFIQKNIFPNDVTKELIKTLHNPAATANGETALLSVLRNYNVIKRDNVLTIQELAEGVLFETEKGKVFKRGAKRRKRYECLEINSGRLYSFSAIAEVRLIKSTS